MFAFD
jgi:hypothetical protein